ncbi:hypothetical protein MIB92_19885, partial [Aestuariirhabdus sp. Z084]|uniref:calcium-binding protein n=1 Tax=Aestuariirhabdus haliotis TaxID=2918751 RepID=UPI0029E7D8C7
ALEFADGTVLNTAQIFGLVQGGLNNEGDDTLSGTEFADGLYGGTGNDTLNGANGADTIYGGVGNDTINAGHHNDTVSGGEGNDTITASYLGSNTLSGDAGDDLIQIDRSIDKVRVGYGASGSGYSNTLEGGQGNDRLEGWTGSDTYLFNRGDGQDVIRDYDLAYHGTSLSYWDKTDSIRLGEGISQDDVVGLRNGNHLVLQIKDPANPDAQDQITIEHAFA